MASGSGEGARERGTKFRPHRGEAAPPGGRTDTLAATPGSRSELAQSRAWSARRGEGRRANVLFGARSLFLSFTASSGAMFGPESARRGLQAAMALCFGLYVLSWTPAVVVPGRPEGRTFQSGRLAGA